MSASEDKRRLRRSGIEARRSVPDRDRPWFNRCIAGHILRSEAFYSAKTILLYRAFDGEAELSALAAFALAAGKKIAYPYCLDRERMIALSPGKENAWVKGAFGILSPDPRLSEQIEASKLDLIVLPCAAFDDSKNRLGMGGGYYDRFLPLCTNATTVLAAFSAQRVEAIPVEKWDQSVDFVATETEMF